MIFVEDQINVEKMIKKLKMVVDHRIERISNDRGGIYAIGIIY